MTQPLEQWSTAQLCNWYSLHWPAVQYQSSKLQQSIIDRLTRKQPLVQWRKARDYKKHTLRGTETLIQKNRSQLHSSDR